MRLTHAHLSGHTLSPRLWAIRMEFVNITRSQCVSLPRSTTLSDQKLLGLIQIRSLKILVTQMRIKLQKH